MEPSIYRLWPEQADNIRKQIATCFAKPYHYFKTLDQNNSIRIKNYNIKKKDTNVMIFPVVQQRQHDSNHEYYTKKWRFFSRKKHTRDL